MYLPGRAGARAGRRMLAPALGISRAARSALTHAIRAAGLPSRGVWSRPGRYHIEVRCVAQPGSEGLARRVEHALERLPGVAWARINAPSGRVVVAVQPPQPRLDDLIATVAAAERARHVEPDPDTEPHPPEEGPRTRRALSTLAADAFGLGLSVATRILPFTPVPGEVAGLANFVDLHPRLHTLVGDALHGQKRADSLFPLVEAVAQGLTGGWAGIAVDGFKRVWQWSEARAQQAAWTSAEDRLTGTAECAAAGPVAIERPRPKPPSRIERYSGAVMSGGVLAGALALPMAGFKRAAALTVSTLPKAADAGREAYGAHLGRVLARRNVIAMDRQVLRELDRIDTLVLDETELRGDRATLTDLAPVCEADPEELVGRAFALFDPDSCGTVRCADGWSLGPIDQLGLPAQEGEAEAEKLGKDGGRVLGLGFDGSLVAVLRADPEPAPGVDALVTAAKRSGLRVVVAGDDTHSHHFANALMPGGDQLVASVRTLQADGAVVMVVSSRPRALAAADCGIGLCQPDTPPPWGAHLLIGPDLAEAALIVDAVGMARVVTEHGLALAGAGSGLGGVLALTSSARQLPARPVAAINGAAGLSFANGVFRAHLVHRRPVPPSVASSAWHLMPVDTVLSRLRTTATGLSIEEASSRRSAASQARNGNSNGDGNRPGLAHAFLEELANPLTPVLMAGAGLSAAVGSPLDAGLVGSLVAVSALVGAAQRVSTERSLAALLARSAVSARVRRGDHERIVTADELVPGDVITVEPGDVIPADCRVIRSDGLEADESSLTGESLPVLKNPRPVLAAAVAERTSMIYEGTTVAAGSADAVVVATGADTEAGRGMAMAGQSPPTTVVQPRLARFTRATAPLAAGSAAAVVGAGLLRGTPLVDTIADATNLAVAAVPEGLPFLVSAAQLAAARRLAEHGALVRNPHTIEALGRVDVLCFDKTGTLTEGRLRLTGVGDGHQQAGVDALNERLRWIVSAAVRACPTAAEPDELPQQTDRAVLTGARRARIDGCTNAPDWRPMTTLPFQPSRGYHATIGRSRDAVLLSVKGAPEAILPRCTRERTEHGARPLDRVGRDRLRHHLERQAGHGHRLLAVAERRTTADAAFTGDEVEQPLSDADVADLTFLGFLALADVVRDKAAPAVRRIREAGVHTIMITGDHPATAAAIATSIRQDGGEQRVLVASDLDRLDDDAFARSLADADVVARCTPAHKVRIIQVLQKQGRTVAMTGDGANDAPAIRLADVGIALGRRGTPAARAAADLVVTDDELETIIAALVEGRTMWASVRHALSILVGGNIGEIAFSIVSAAATGRSALTSRQFLLVNLLTDLAPAMSVAVRPPRPDSVADLLSEGPEASLGSALAGEIARRATSTTLGATTAWTLARLTGRRRRASTVALAALVGTQLGQTALAGGTNRTTVAASAASAAALGAIIQTPGLSQFFGCTPLGPVGWGIATGSAAGATLANLVGKRLSELRPIGWFTPGRPGPDQGRPEPDRGRPEPDQGRPESGRKDPEGHQDHATTRKLGPSADKDTPISRK